jgi:4-amino-4-deoxy-L-arabinose transferase-like glycosyltransferase
LFYLSLVIGTAFALRVINLNNLPLSLSLDEATNGLDALQLLRLSWFTPFLQNNFGRETPFFYIQALALWSYGISFFSLRFASVLAGTVSIPLLYIVGRRLKLDQLLFYQNGNDRFSMNTVAHRLGEPGFFHSTVIALLATTGLAVSYWHVYFSRLGLRAILLPPLLLGLIWCFWQGWYALPDKPGRRRWLIAAGFLLGLSFYTYLAARLLPVIFLTFVVIELIKNKSAYQEKTIDFLLFGLTATLLAIPLGFYFHQNPQAFGSRIEAVSILAAKNPPDAFIDNLISLLRIYFLGATWLERWPALNLLSALGLLFGPLANILYKTTNRIAIERPISFFVYPFTTLWLLLVFGSLTTIHNYFSIWATTYHIFSDHPAYMARYLNHKTDQLTLTPIAF